MKTCTYLAVGVASAVVIIGDVIGVVKVRLHPVVNNGGSYEYGGYTIDPMATQKPKAIPLINPTMAP